MRYLARHHVAHPSIEDQANAVKYILEREGIVNEDLNLIIANMV